DPAQGPRAVRRARQPVRGHALSFADRRTRVAARCPGNHGVDTRERVDGFEAQAARDVGGAVPPRVDPHRLGPEAHREFPHPLPQSEPGVPECTSMILTAIARAVGREDLSGELAQSSMEQILAGEATAAQIAALAIALRMKGE